MRSPPTFTVDLKPCSVEAPIVANGGQKPDRFGADYPDYHLGSIRFQHSTGLAFSRSAFPFWRVTSLLMSPAISRASGFRLGVPRLCVRVIGRHHDAALAALLAVDALEDLPPISLTPVENRSPVSVVRLYDRAHQSTPRTAIGKTYDTLRRCSLNVSWVPHLCCDGSRIKMGCPDGYRGLRDKAHGSKVPRSSTALYAARRDLPPRSFEQITTPDAAYQWCWLTAGTWPGFARSRAPAAGRKHVRIRG